MAIFAPIPNHPGAPKKTAVTKRNGGLVELNL
jgi:hypothetical protein